jgi:phosphate transport system ATP-binding protein
MQHFSTPETRESRGDTQAQKPATALSTRNLDFYYGPVQSLHGINLDLPERRVTAFIGPSGCGKSTLLRCFNRMNDLIRDTRVEGRIEIHGRDIHAPGTLLEELRREVGMVFQRSNPFPSRSTRTWPTGRVCTARRIARCWTASWKPA